MTISQRVPTLINSVRMFLRDFPRKNELKGKEETSDQEIFLFLNMALDDWNSTPPLIGNVTVDTHPSFSWLIICTAMFVLASEGVLEYRNDLSYSDGGVNLNPWTKGPAYTNLAGIWSQQLEQKKSAMKYALNASAVSGVIPSAEYFAWDYQNYQYAGFGGSESGVPLTGGTLLPTTAIQNPTPQTQTPNSSPVMSFDTNTWLFNSGNSTWVLTYFHNLNEILVDIKLYDPNTGQDLRNKPAEIIFTNRNEVQLVVPSSPDGRFIGNLIVYKINPQPMN